VRFPVEEMLAYGSVLRDNYDLYQSLLQSNVYALFQVLGSLFSETSYSARLELYENKCKNIKKKSSLYK